MDTNETIELLDLEPIDEVKGGVSHTAGRCSCGQEHPSGGGGFINNHNETVVSDEDNNQHAIADLEVPNADEVKGGPLSVAQTALSGLEPPARDGVRDLLIFNANGSVS